MIRVLYDYQIFASQSFGGISRYCHELCKHVDRADGFSAHIDAPLHINAYLAADPCCGTGLYVPLHSTSGMIASLQKMAVFLGDALTSFLLPGSADIVHETFYYGRFSGHAKGAARVVTVHDMIHERFPESFSSGDQTVRRKREAVARADHVICNSYRTQADVLDMLQVPPSKVSTVHLGFSFPIDEDGSNSPVSFPYIFFVGNRSGYKNFASLVEAIGAFHQLRDNFGLVCFGGGRFTASEWALMEKSGLDSARIEHAVGDDRRLARYYRHAEVFVYPSLYEGFGIPPLEAMLNNCPVVCGDVASLPEVVGQAAELCLPQEPASIAAALEKLLFDTQRRDYMVQAGRERVKLFSWEKCAQETVKVYQGLM